jgi:hypothetical protein
MREISQRDFLSAVWPQTLLRFETLELKAIRRTDGYITREFFTSLNDFTQTIQTLSDRDLYFGISTRFQQGGKKKDCYRVQAVWMDFDKPELPTFTLKPNLLVSSGNGWHIYWLLKSPIFLRSGRWTEVEAVTRGICKKFKGDMTTIDITRVLRVPDTLNHKSNPPKPVKAFMMD